MLDNGHSPISGKSKKGFQPKAPIRRSAVPGPASSQASVRNSVDRQTQPAIREPTPQPHRVVASPANVPHRAVAVLAPLTNQAETTNVEAAKDLANALTTTSANSSLELENPAAEQDLPVSILIPERHSTPLDLNAKSSAVTHNSDPHQIGTEFTPSQQPSKPIDQPNPSSQQNLPSRPTSELPQHTRQHKQKLQSEQAPKLSESYQSSKLPRHPSLSKRRITLNKRSQNTTEEPRHPKRVRHASSQADEPSYDIQRPSSEETGKRSSGQFDSTDQRSIAHNKGTGEARLTPKRREASGTSKSTTRRGGEAAASTKRGKSRKIQARGHVRRGRSKSQRSPTPEDAENVTIEEDVIRMEELCSERRTGKKSVRSGEIQVFEAAEAERRAAAKARQVAGEEPLAPAEADQEPEGSMLAPQTQIINGEIVLIEESTRIDRHAMADAQREADAVVIVEENALTTRINSHYNLKRSPHQRWTDEDTEEFYNALKMFGTDFEIISKMFPTRSRRAVKLKYTHEEKVNQARISRTLYGERIPVNIEEFSEWTETTYADPAILHAEMETDRRALEEEQAKEKELMEEARRQREAETAAEAAAVGADTSAKENEEQDPSGKTSKVGRTTKRGEAKSQKTKKHQTRRGRKLPNVGGGQVEVLGRIEDNVHHQPKAPTS